MSPASPSPSPEPSAAPPGVRLLNMLDFFDRLEGELARVRRYARPASLVLLALDPGRARQRGRARRERALATVAGVLERGLREVDMACRSVDDEFLIFLPETPVSGAEACLERILLEIQALRVAPLSDLSASAGIVPARADATTVRLVGEATDALALARRSGGGRSVVLSGRIDAPHGG